MYALQSLHSYRIITHVHDEVVIECDRENSVKNICDLMSQSMSWASNLLLRADGYEYDFYKKD